MRLYILPDGTSGSGHSALPEMVAPTTTFSEMGIEQHASRYHHTVLQYFRTHSTAVATVDELAGYISDQQDGAKRQVAIRLHHVTLPKLAAAGLIDYDTRSNTARYR